MPSITLLLHNIRSIHNVGSIFRSAEGFNVEKIILSGYTPYPTLINDSRLPHISQKITKQMHKTALGAETLVPFEYVENISKWIDEIDVPLIGLEQTLNSVPINLFRPPAAFVLILGEEVSGISGELLDACKTCIEIPMHGKKESFNVSVAAGIALYSLTSN